MIALLFTAFLHIETCEASVFAYDGDKLAGGVAPYLGRRVRPDDHGIAHRTLPLGSDVWLFNIRTWTLVKTKIIDRGPFGRLDKRGRWFNGSKLYRWHLRRRLPIPTEGWIRCVDMTPKIKHMLGHNGREPVIVFAAGIEL